MNATTNPEVGACWVRRWALRGAWKRRKHLRKLDPKSDLTRRALVAYVEVLGENKKTGYLQTLLRQQRGMLQADAQLWGSVGYALLLVQKYRSVIAWLENWSKRADVLPWMLLNLVASLLRLGLEKEALEVSRRAVTLKPDHTTAQHQLWLALESALQGEAEHADAILSEIREDELSAYTKTLLSIIQALRAVQSAPPGERRSELKKQRRLRQGGLSAASNPIFWSEHALCRARQRALCVVYQAANRPILAWLHSWMP